MAKRTQRAHTFLIEMRGDLFSLSAFNDKACVHQGWLTLSSTATVEMIQTINPRPLEIKICSTGYFNRLIAGHREYAQGRELEPGLSDRIIAEYEGKKVNQTDAAIALIKLGKAFPKARIVID